MLSFTIAIQGVIYVVKYGNVALCQFLVRLPLRPVAVHRGEGTRPSLTGPVKTGSLRNGHDATSRDGSSEPGRRWK